MVNLSEYGNLRLLQYTAQMISDLLEGEWIQDSLVKDFSVTIDQLDQVHYLKTASLFKWCLRAPFLTAEIYLIGLLFQRSDDLLDFDIRNHEGKAVLGDLKSGYINSFSAVLMEDLSKENRELYVHCQTMKGLREVVGEDYFNAKLKLFDDINQSKIDLYGHHLQRLIESLPASQRGVEKELSRLPRILYWRDPKA